MEEILELDKFAVGRVGGASLQVALYSGGEKFSVRLTPQLALDVVSSLLRLMPPIRRDDLNKLIYFPEGVVQLGMAGVLE